MNVHELEEIEFSRTAYADKFAGFDRGDSAEPVDSGEIVIGRLTSEAGHKVEIVESFCREFSMFYVRVDGRQVTPVFDTKAEAVVVGHWWMNGCPM